jgi:predicted amidohydrolase YtcJ
MRFARSLALIRPIYPRFHILLLVAALSLTGCATLRGQKPAPADLVVINANIYTMVSKDARADAMAIKGDRIIAVGKNDAIRKRVGPSTRAIDARGRLVIPGFNDAHVHFMGIGNTFSTIDLREAKTPADISARVVRYVRFLPRGRWILGHGWRDAAPDKAAIDKIAPDNPVFVYRADGEAAFANAFAMKLGGLTVDPGETSGIVRGDAMRRIARSVPANHTRNWSEIAETATNYAASLGVTSVHDMHSDDLRDAYRELHRNGKLKTRVYDCIPLPDWKKLAEKSASSANDAMVRGGCLKSFSDGDEESGARLARDVPAADKAGLQIMAHAIGNSANRIVLEVFENAAKENGPRDRRFRVEHAHNPRPSDVPRFARTGIIASMQPYLFYGGTGGFYSTLLKQNARLAFGSDAAITDFDPLLGVHAAVNAGVESISVYDAVRAYTVGSAYAEFQEKEKGTIEAGKLADFVILSEDIFAPNARTIRDTVVVMTVVAGRVVYER